MKWSFILCGQSLSSCCSSWRECIKVETERCIYRKIRKFPGYRPQIKAAVFPYEGCGEPAAVVPCGFPIQGREGRCLGTCCLRIPEGQENRAGGIQLEPGDAMVADYAAVRSGQLGEKLLATTGYHPKSYLAGYRSESAPVFRIIKSRHRFREENNGDGPVHG